MNDKCKCGKPHDGWPGNDGTDVCQDCWEAQCDKSWWEMVLALRSAPPEQQKEGQ